MTYNITRETVIGRYNNPTDQDIFQIVGPGDDNILAMDYLGLLHPSSVPIVQNSLLAIDTNVPQSVTNNNIETSLYQVALYLESRGDGGGGTTCVATIVWSSPAGAPRTITLTLDGDTDNVQQENYVILALQGSNITVSTAFSGASFHYDIAIAIALLPTGGAA
jgi:hypothetical protein